MYINGIGNIAPIGALGDGLPQLTDGVFNAVEPEYSPYINPRMMRRMARIIKMSVAASNMALQNAGIEKPTAIITATGLGCSEDTELFLRSVIEDGETLLAPTSFIKSTHNTIGGQIALLLGVTGYNMTYVHRDTSFESALLDAKLLLMEQPTQQVLLGAADELTPSTIKLQHQLGCINNVEGTQRNGGEGASFFACSNTKISPDAVQLVDVAINIGSDEEQLHQFLQKNNLQPTDIDLVLTGAYNNYDYQFNFGANFEQQFSNAAIAMYQSLCGSYFTASAFACWLAVSCIRQQQLPSDVLMNTQRPQNIRRVLVCNRSKRHQSLILLSAC